MIALSRMMAWLDTPSPVSSDTPATAACAITSDIPIPVSGSSMATGLRYTSSSTPSTSTAIAISIGRRSRSPSTVRSATVAAGPAMCTCSPLPAAVWVTKAATRVNASKAGGVPSVPARPTGSAQAFLSLLVRNGRSEGVSRKSCTITTSPGSARSASTRVR